MKYKTELPFGLQSLAAYLEGSSDTIQLFLQEALNLKDLGEPAISNLTSKHLDNRLNDPNADHTVKVIEAKWKVQEAEVVLYFYCAPTYDNRTVMTPSARPYQGTFYNVVLQFTGVESALGTIEAFTALSKNARERAMKEMIWTCPVKVYSNDPSFYYQGVWEDLAKVDGTVFSFPGPTGTGLWHNRHVGSGGLSNPNIRVTKHIGQIVTHMWSFIPTITRELKKIE
jgi:hypothetical protein